MVSNNARPVLTGALALIILIALAPAVAFCEPAQGTTLRIGLVGAFGGVRQISVSADGAFSIKGSDGRAVLAVPGGGTATLQVSGPQISVRQGNAEVAAVASPLLVSPDDPTVPVGLSRSVETPKRYRGVIEISAKSGVLQIVNVIGLEDYLKGVVPREMPSMYPPEALKAQAVAARTYALRNRGKFKSRGYDLCDTTTCQGYGGASAEKLACTRAVTDTVGMVLTYDGKLADVMYSTDCGGATQDYSERRPGGHVPYLCTVVEPAGIAHGTWEVKFTLQELERKLTAMGVKGIRGLSAIRVASAGPSGRVLDLELTASSGKVTLPGAKIREMFKSGLYTVDAAEDGSVVFRGKGAGHGCGLCQVGARGLASEPYNYTFDHILAHYFSGTQLSGGAPVATPVVAERSQPAGDRPEPPPVQQRRVEVTTVPQQPTAAPAKEENKGELKLRVRLKAPEPL